MTALGESGESRVWNDTARGNPLLWCPEPDIAEIAAVVPPGLPEGQKGFLLKLKKFDAARKAEAIQLLFFNDMELQKGRRYEISFYCKASVSGSFQMVTAQAEKPWTSFSGAPQTVTVTETWTLNRVIFAAAENSSGRLVTPRVMFGKYGSNADIYLGPVRFREIPISLECRIGSENWTLFTAVKPPAEFSSIPATLEGVNGEPVAPQSATMPPDGINLVEYNRGVLSPEKCAILYHRFSSDKAGSMRIGVAADWWMELFINGRSIFNTMKQGNQSHTFNADDHILEIPIVKGDNLLAVKVLSGSGGWRFVCGNPSRGIDEKPLLIIQPGSSWKAIDMERLTVKPGTALDFSMLTEERNPAGSMGRIIVNAKGRLAFEKAPEQAVRLFSFNVNPWLLSLSTMPKAGIAKYAEDLARQGYNMLRIQGIDLFLIACYRPPFQFRPHGAPGWLPQQVEDIQFNPTALDHFDYLLHCLKKNGIYVNLDLMNRGFVNSQNPRSIGGGSKRVLFDPMWRQHWKIVTEYLLNTPNRYTGIKLKDDPAIAFLEPLNEQDYRFYDDEFLHNLRPLFQAFLKTKYRTAEAMQNAWSNPQVNFENIPDISEAMLRKGDIVAEDAGQFLMETMSEMTDWYFHTLREHGYPGLVTQWDMIMRCLEIPVRAKMPVGAQHCYVSHPGGVPSKNLVEKSKESTIWPGKDMSIPQGSSLNSSYFRSSAAIRFLDRPYLITEYSQSAPNRYRHERGLYFGAYAALQGWDSLAAHGNLGAVIQGLSSGPFCGFENPQDPISRASEAVVALAWFRSDVTEALHTVELAVSDQLLFPKHFLSAIGDDYAKMSMLTKIGITYSGRNAPGITAKVKPDWSVIPEAFSPLATNQWFATASNQSAGRFPELLDQLRKRGIIDSQNRTDYSTRIYQSDTGEITLNGIEETMTVVSPRLEGAVIKKGHPVNLKNLQITECSEPASVVVASLDRNKTVGESKHLLLIFATNALNKGETFENSSMQLMVEVGQSPVLVKTARLGLKLRTLHPGAVEIYALHLDGTRMADIPARNNGGVIDLALDTGKLPYGSVFFEIVIR